MALSIFSHRVVLLVALALNATNLRAEATKQHAAAASVAPKSPSASRDVILEPLYDGGLKGHWQDWGWAERDTELGKPARLNFSANAGWILVQRGLTGTFTALVFYMNAPAQFGDFLEVRLAGENEDTFPRISVDAKHQVASTSGWLEVRIPLAELNPQKHPFDRVIIRAAKSVPADWVNIDKISLLSSTDVAMAAINTRGSLQHRASMQLDCTKAARPISSLIYGIAYNPRRNDAAQWRLGATSRRWGGNPASRYNWRLGNAWNTGNDWFFTNVNYSSIPNFTWESFLDENRDHGIKGALTVPMIGWVAKDTKSYSFPVSVYGKQREANHQNPDAGDGQKPNGAKLAPADPRRTSIPASPEFVGDWVNAIHRYDEDKGGRSINEYILDNEPALWNSTHRDVHPEPVTYDELLQRTIDYGSQIRKADPTAIIAGPAEWGWPGYFFSAKDAEAGFVTKPDRRAHNDEPLLAWYLKQLQAYEQRTGQRLLNVLDVHYYPQGEGIYGARESNDPSASERRIRSTRSLWDPTYKDESWVNERIRLLPRLHALVEENYPGMEISVGEYNFGGERYMSGALSLAEVLGRFGQEGVYSAYYWTAPPDTSCASQAFRAYRNYDGDGAHFLEQSIPTTGDRGTSIFASQDETGGKIVAIALNLDPRESAEAVVDLVGCGSIGAGRTFQYTGTADGIHKIDDKVSTDGRSTIKQRLPPYSITIFEMTVDRGSRY